jgi:hypothetical protein
MMAAAAPFAISGGYSHLAHLSPHCLSFLEDQDDELVPVVGPTEIRQAAAALNAMQAE